MASKTPAQSRPNFGATMVLVLGTVGFTGALFGLFWLSGVAMPYFGFLFLLYWAAILKQNWQDYLPSVVGGVVGILLGWLVVDAPTRWGAPGIIIATLALGLILVLYLRQQASLIANNATWLFVTVATVSELHISRNVGTMIASLLLGASYIGAMTGAGALLAKRRAPVDV